MNQLVKVTLATGLALSAMVGTTSSVTSNSTFIAQGSENIDYQVNGYTTDANDFILEPSFIEDVKNNNFVINGYNITGNEQQESSMIDIYDQIIAKTGEQTASMVDFEVKKGAVSKEALIEQYGQPIEKPFESAQGFDYRYHMGDNIVQFIVEDGYVKDVQINSENE